MKKLLLFLCFSGVLLGQTQQYPGATGSGSTTGDGTTITVVGGVASTISTGSTGVPTNAMVQAQMNEFRSDAGAAGSGDAYTGCPSTAITAYHIGQTFWFATDTQNITTTPTTINICTLGALAVVKNVAGAVTAVAAGDIKGGTGVNSIWYELVVLDSPATKIQVNFNDWVTGMSVPGSGTELQYRSSATALNALANSSVPNAGQLNISTTPTANATQSVFGLGSAIAAGPSAANTGTYYGINSAAAFVGDYLHFENNGSLFFRLGTIQSKSAINLQGSVLSTDGAGGLYIADTNGNSTCCSLQEGINTTRWLLNTSGRFGTYDSQTVVDSGVPYEPAHIDLTTQAAAITNTTALYTTPTTCAGSATGCLVRVSYYAKVTRADTNGSPGSVLGGTVGFQVLFTDGNDSVAQTVTLPATSQAGNTITIGTGNTGNSTTTVSQGTGVMFVKSNTAMTYGFGYATNGSGATAMQFSLHVKVEVM